MAPLAHKRRAKRAAAPTPCQVTPRARLIIRFIEDYLIVPSGVGEGQPFKLIPEEIEFIAQVYGPLDGQGRRIRRRAILSMARKNGKTAIIAALVLVHLVGPEETMHGEIYSAANDRDQAAIVFKFANQIVNLSPKLWPLCKVVPSTKTMIGLATASVYRAISAEAGTKHGYSPTVVIYDELAQSKKRDLYDVLDTSFGARLEPLFIIIGTQSNDPQHIMSQLIDDGLARTDPTIYVQLHAVPDDTPDEEIWNEEIWKLANPALGIFRSLEDMRTLARKARRMPAEEPKFRNLYLNQRVSPQASLINRAEWMACKGDSQIRQGEEVFLALDLSAIIDLAALVMVSADEETTRVMPFFWKPEEYLVEHSKRDFGSGNRHYEKWAKDGKLLTSPGKSIDPLVIGKKIAELFQTYRVRGLAYDRWRIRDILRVFDLIGLQAYLDTEIKQQPGSAPWEMGLRLVPWGQGFVDMAPAVDALELEVVDGRLVHSGHDVLNWNMRNAIAVMDPSGNRKIDKEKSRFRVDGAVSTAMAIGLKSRDRHKQVDVLSLIG